MKFKTLMLNDDFAIIENEKIFTAEVPQLLPETATIEAAIQMLDSAENVEDLRIVEVEVKIKPKMGDN